MAVIRKPPKKPGTMQGKKIRSPSKRTASYQANFAWNYNIPCQNKECKSYGKPHPNCKCHAPLAEGGEVGNYCDVSRAHGGDCEYFKDGGQVLMFDDLPSPGDDRGNGAPAPLMFDDLPAPGVAPTTEPTKPTGPLMFDDLPAPGSQADAVDTVAPGKYDSTKQRLIGDAEAVARGFLTGPIATGIETKLLGVDPADIAGRQEARPFETGALEAGALAASLLSPAGPAKAIFGGIGAGAKVAARSAGAGKVGSKVVQMFVEGASFVGADEMTKTMLGRGDAEDAVGAAVTNMGVGGIINVGTGGLFSLTEKAVGKGLSSLKNKETVAKVENLLAEIGEGGKPLEAIKQAMGKVEQSVATAAVTSAPHVGIPATISYYVARRAIKPFIEKSTGRLNDLATDAVIYSMIKNEAAGVPNAIHWANNVLNGAKKTSTALDAIFKGVNVQVAAPTADEIKRQMEGLSEFIKEGQVLRQMENEMADANAPGMAKGGMVASDGNRFASLYPDQNMLLTAAKGRVSSYLNSIRPIEQPKRPFDKPLPQTDKNRQYTRAMRLAIDPVQVLRNISDGDLTPDDMKHFTQMFPDVYRYYSKEITKRITNAQLNNDEPPPYKVRQSMSLFMGAALDSTFTPEAIQAAQAVYARKAQPQPTPKMSQGNLSKLAPSSLTNEQARITRQQNAKT